MLLVEQAVVLESDADVARHRPQAHVHLPDPAELREQPSAAGMGRRRPRRRGQRRAGRRISVAWGDADAVSAVAAHRDAGADHVCIQVLGPDATALPLEQWRALAAALIAW